MARAEIAHSFQDEIFFGLRRRAAISAWIAGLSLTVALLAVAGLVVMLPLKEVKPYVVMVDRTTGEAETVVETRARRSFRTRRHPPGRAGALRLRSRNL